MYIYIQYENIYIYIHTDIYTYCIYTYCIYTYCIYILYHTCISNHTMEWREAFNGTKRSTSLEASNDDLAFAGSMPSLDL